MEWEISGVRSDICVEETSGAQNWVTFFPEYLAREEGTYGAPEVFSMDKKRMYRRARLNRCRIAW